MSDIIEGLNDKQKEAVLQVKGPCLVIAGAGSGKTKVLTHKIAYLIEKEGVRPWNVLAITFTNKAANEMKERVENLIGDVAKDMWIGTFHSICVRILRRYIDRIGFTSSFIIFDTSDQRTLVKQCLKQLNIDDKMFTDRAVLSEISNAKNEMLEPDQYRLRTNNDFRKETIAQVYSMYQKRLRENNAIDFDDIINYTIKILSENPDVLDYYSEKFEYVLVDEYQDTNKAQFMLISILAARHGNITVVGDNDQCLIKGTKILTEKGEKKVEDIKKGTKVICASGYGKVQIGNVSKNKKRLYSGKVIKLKTKKGKEIKGTPNHIIFARLVPDANSYYVYLMYKDKIGYRIGQTRGVRKNDKSNLKNGLEVRLRQEKGDKIWLLKTCSTLKEATYYEEYFACNYGIPKLVFSSKGRQMVWEQDDINRLFREIDTEKRAKELLHDLDMYEEYPCAIPQASINGGTQRKIVNINYFSGREKKFGPYTHRIYINSSDEQLKQKLLNNNFNVRKGKASTWRVETERASYEDAYNFGENLAETDESILLTHKIRLTERESFRFMPLSHIRKNMKVAIYDSDGKIEEDIVEDVEIEEYTGEVYDIDIPNFHQYIAGGICVHNCIYGFRGSDITNILNFEKDFPGTKIIKLEQNYRCTQNILDAANAVIKNNETKYEKKLWTENGKGGMISVYRGTDEYDEANFIVENINRLRREEYMTYNDFAVLYRMNSQSRSIEDILRRENMPYKIVGGLKFYERKEIKDTIAYLRLIQNPSDNLSLVRIINEPKRGIGRTSLDNVEQVAIQAETSMYDVIKRADEFGLNRVYVNSREFISQIEELRSKKDDMQISDLIKETLNKTGYTKALEDEDTSEAETRLENIEEFLTVAMEFEEQFAENSLEEFLEGITLSSDIDNADTEDDSVTLMTLHSAKGLEFPVVFLVGMEEGIFPGYKSIGEPKELEEERRLCYVGITRAKQNLFISCARQRTIFGSTSCNKVSRFVEEIPKELMDGYDEAFENQSSKTYEDFQYEWKYGQNKVTTYKSDDVATAKPKTQYAFKTAESFLNSLNKQTASSSVDISIYRSGQRVYHKKFGEGKINYVEQEGDDAKVDITFEKVGHKRLMAKYAGLEVLD